MHLMFILATQLLETREHLKKKPLSFFSKIVLTVLKRKPYLSRRLIPSNFTYRLCSFLNGAIIKLYKQLLGSSLTANYGGFFVLFLR